jgi:hypothetical protein
MYEDSHLEAAYEDRMSGDYEELDEEYEDYEDEDYDD